MKRFGAVGGILVVAIAILVFLQLRSFTSVEEAGGPSGGPGLTQESAEVLAQQVLKRFDGSLQLDRLSVAVEGAASRQSASLLFEYYTPLGDRSFRLPIVYRDGKWFASERDMAAIEKRFER
jgi:hypothetical protein